MQAYPAAPALREVILHLHADDGVHTGEGINRNANQGAIAQSDGRADVGGVEQRAGLVSVEYGRLAFLDDIFRAAHSMPGSRR
jgi:hypothetical protein